MTGLILTIHFIVCIFMIIVILLQAGKGADMGATFGGGSQTVFGPRGAATFLSKVTTIAAIIFLVTSVYLANVSKHQVTSSVVRGAKLPPGPKPESTPAGSESAPETDPVKSESKPESKPK
jgi:preprotein translocase subunit SecG